MLKMILFEKQAVPFKSLRTKVLLKIIFIKICKENRATFGLKTFDIVKPVFRFVVL